MNKKILWNALILLLLSG